MLARARSACLRSLGRCIHDRAAPSLGGLRRHLKRLRQVNRRAKQHMAERDCVKASLRQWCSEEREHDDTASEKHSTQGKRENDGSSSSKSESAARSFSSFVESQRRMRSEALRVLPRNPELASSMAFMLHLNRDARVELEFTRHFVRSTLLSLAAPVGVYDPFDTKPQVFALDNYLALPVFTSLYYLQQFCARFRLEVRDPSGVLWADGRTVDSGSAVNGTDENTDATDAIQIADAQCSTRGGRSSGDDSEHFTEDRDVACVPHEEHVDQTSRAPEVDLLTIDDLFDSMDNTKESNIHSTRTSDATTTMRQTIASAHELDANRSSQSSQRECGVLGSAASKRPSRVPRSPGRRGARAPKKSTRPKPRHRRACQRSRAPPRSARRPKRLSAMPHTSLLAESRSAKQRVRAARASMRTNKRAWHTKRKHTQRQGVPRAKRTQQQQQQFCLNDQTHRFLHTVGNIAPLHIKQATPLPIFGQPIRPFFIGYFADVQTLLHNAAIVPRKVDIILNPCSPLEFVLARESTDRILFGDQLLIQAYGKLEKELQREFAAFFKQCCPEVTQARSACVPLPIPPCTTPDSARRRKCEAHSMNDSQSVSGCRRSRPFTLHRDDRARTLRESEYSNGVAYELVILIESNAMAATFGKMRWAKEQNSIMGHAELDVIPLEVAAPHVREAARVFYSASADEPKEKVPLSRSHGEVNTRTSAKDGASAAVCDGRGGMGVFTRVGTHQTISVTESPDSYFHDPSNVYTEAHSVFTDSLKMGG